MISNLILSNFEYVYVFVHTHIMCWEIKLLLKLIHHDTPQYYNNK